MSTRVRLLACALLAAACSGEQPEPVPQTAAAAVPEPSICAEPHVTGRLPRSLHEASGLESKQRLADGHRADSEGGGELRLIDACTGAKHSAEEEITQAVEHPRPGGRHGGLAC